MIAALTFPQALWLLLCVQSPASLLFVGGLLGMAILYLVSACAGLIRAYRYGVTQHDREAQVLREVRAAVERLPADDELPGMWERADLIGGRADSDVRNG